MPNATAEASRPWTICPQERRRLEALSTQGWEWRRRVHRDLYGFRAAETRYMVAADSLDDRHLRAAPRDCLMTTLYCLDRPDPL
jgi:hypothetical protein